jgi:hypothetical protein
MRSVEPLATGFRGLVLDDVGGHFQPPGILLRIGEEAFARMGIYFAQVNPISG